MNKQEIAFTAAVTSIYMEDKILTISFADSNSQEPENYLILQQNVPKVNGDEYYFEINDQSFSGEGSWQLVRLEEGNLLIIFSERIAKKHSCTQLKIYGVDLTCNVEELIHALHQVFDTSDALLEVA